MGTLSFQQRAAEMSGEELGSCPSLEMADVCKPSKPSPKQTPASDITDGPSVMETGVSWSFE